VPPPSTRDGLLQEALLDALLRGVRDDMFLVRGLLGISAEEDSEEKSHQDVAHTRSKDSMIHLLEDGRALCGFHPGAPSEWPDGHRWVSVEKLGEVRTDDPSDKCGDCHFVAFGCKLTCEGGSERGTCPCFAPTACALLRAFSENGRIIPRLKHRLPGVSGKVVSDA
jgi:hypothetical protein